MLDKIVYYATTFAEAGLSVFGMSGVYEQPRYEVRQALGPHLEVRDYAPRVAAEATVAGTDREQAGRAAFKLLFDYITGANMGGRRMAMTAPVQQEADPELIAMTAPAQTETTASLDGVRLSMRFFLPARLADDPPAPRDTRVRIVALPSATVVALRFSGALDDSARVARERELLARLADTPWQPVGTPYVLGYDPPFAIPFLRRNEVVVAVAPR